MRENSKVQIGGNYYTMMKFQPWELTTEIGAGHHLGMVISCISRARFKDGKLDLMKAHHCLDYMKEVKMAAPDEEAQKRNDIIISCFADANELRRWQYDAILAASHGQYEEAAAFVEYGIGLFQEEKKEERKRKSWWKEAIIIAFVVLLSVVTAVRCSAQTYEDVHVLAHAFAMVESAENPKAVNGQCVGWLQITPIMVAEVNRLLDTNMFQLKDRYDISKSITMFAVVMYHKNRSMSIRKACAIWNPRASEEYYTRVKNYYELLMKGGEE